MAATRSRTRSPLPMELLKQAASVLRVLGHPLRLKMVDLLLDRSRPVGELAEEVGLAPAAVSQHLNNMRAHGIVASRREGRQVFYEVVHPCASVLIECLREPGPRRSAPR